MYFNVYFILEKMIIDQDVIKITKGTAITACRNSANQINETTKDEQDDFITIDSQSSESSSNESDIEVVDQYKLNDRNVIGKYSECCIVLIQLIICIILILYSKRFLFIFS